MNKLILLFGVLICLVVVNARHHVDRNADETSEDREIFKPREHISGHRRKRWQSSYGYDYPPPNFYYPERREDRNNQEVIHNIYRLLEDISNYIRRTPPPPPQPQPIYIPYPVAFPTKTSCKTPQNTSDAKVPIPDRRNTFTDSMDQNRNWGFVLPVEDYSSDDENDGARPISFEPLVPKQLMKRPSPQVEHGSQQASLTTEAPKFAPSAPIASAGFAASSQSSITVPGMCNAAILSCCGFSGDTAKQGQCFASVGCTVSFRGGSACSSDSIQRALDSFKAAYSPVQ